MKHLLTDTCFVRVEKHYEDEIEINGVKIKRNILGSEVTGGTIEPKDQMELLYLKRKLLNFQRKPAKYKQEIKDVQKSISDIENYDTEIVGSYNANEDIRIFGEVVAVPTKLSDRMLYMEDEGEPHHMRYVSHDVIKSSFGHIKRSQYFPATFEATGVSMKDLKIEIKEGDKIYFHYLSTNSDAEIGRDEKGIVYAIPYELCFAKVINGEVIPINKYVICEYEFEDNVGRFGIILSADKKPKYLVAKVKYSGSGSELKPGDIVYYQPNADFQNLVEGKMALVMLERFVMAKIE